ncbi:DUF6497 family protein [Rhodovulum euryhalinum]|uniref:Acetolactate synthase n=1 Tax=Rhodovulum euryhalinum TaxID=35805 RepID=A0A4R2KB78_9RHOB|nr:DUF6497 family protein [Rhodovulum euryhalinum]TCO69297.1 hypothetical protein EV655_11625 [Rhodovulum euryhalinum]
MPDFQMTQGVSRPVAPFSRWGKAAGCVSHVLALALAASSLSAQGLIDVPSGQPVTHHDTITGEPGPEGLTLRFRFLAPQIAREGGAMPFELAAGDMEYLCETYALPRLAEIGPKIAQVVITLMDRPVDFGAPAPEATQFFEAFRPEDGRCVWEGF